MAIGSKDRFSSPLQACALAVLLSGLAVGLRWLLDPVFGDQFRIIFLQAAVAAAVLLGGYRPAVLTCLLGLVASIVLFFRLPPGGSLPESAVIGLSSYFLGCGIVIILGESVRRANRKVRQQEAVLLGNERDLEDFFENAPYGMHWVDAKGIIERVNRAELQLLGYSRAEYLGHPISEFHLDPGLIADLLQQVQQGKSVQDVPARLRRKDGGIEHVLISSNGYFDEGRFVHSRCFTRAVTELKKAEETHARLAAIVAASDDAILSKSVDGIIRSWNAAAERLLGYREDEILGQPINTILPPDLHQEELEIISRIRRGERVQHFDTLRLHKDGRLIELSVTVSPIFDAAGEVIGASTIARDIGELKQAERHFRLMADAAPVLICTAGPDKGCTWFNRQWLEFTGRSMADELGDGWADNVHPDDYDHCLRGYQLNFDERQPFTLEYRLKRHDGEYRWMLDKGLPLYNASGEFTGYIGCCTDITDHKLAEAALQTADRRKDEFLAILAHELRNPLAPIGNSLEILKRVDKQPELLPQARDTIERQLSHMVRLVDDLLNVSRISQDKLTLRRKPIPLAGVVAQAVETVQPLLTELGHELQVNLPADAIYLEADSVRLAQVLSNLLNNACKYTAPGGRITLSAQVSDGELMLRVKDNGIGIEKEKLASIFEMFGQAEIKLTQAIGGLGIGLTLAKRLVEMHGGRIVAHSEGLGHGSEFVVYLAVLSEAAQPLAAAPPTNEALGQSRRILIVDDNLDSAESLAVLLRLDGHSVEKAHDGLQGLAKAEQFRPDLILLDIGLPEMDGYAACRQLREQSWGKTITVAALTGWAQEEDRRKTREAGFDAHLVKPVSYQSLNELINAPSACVTTASGASEDPRIGDEAEVPKP